MNFVTPKAGAKCELLFNKPASAFEAGSLNKGLDSALGVMKFMTIVAMNLVTLKAVASGF
jgi:hypothetical protein